MASRRPGRSNPQPKSGGRKPVKGGAKAGAKAGVKAPDSTPRIIGGRFRGKRLAYSGDARTRPMKDRVREATFNLIGPVDATTLAIDLFAGTGALALEALSRGARDAILIERHFPTAKLIRQNAETLGVQDHCRIVTSDTLPRGVLGRVWMRAL